MKRLPHLLIFFCVFWSLTSYGQTQTAESVFEDYKRQQANKIIPPSPNASSFGIYGNVSVGHYTGLPNISIPIYEIKTGDFSLPITLSYHASGIKVAQESSTVGLGWILNAGGCIVREVKHKDDFAYGGYYSDQSVPVCNGENDLDNKNDYQYLEYLNNNKDSEPDMFSYNFGNMSGSFFFERYKESDTNTSNRAEAIISNKNAYLKIILNKTTYDGVNFEIADAYGNTYLFGSSEKTKVNSCALDYSPKEQDLDRGYFSGDTNMEVVTAWYLDKIITSKRDTINFEYEKEEIYSPIRVSEDVSYMFSVEVHSKMGDGPKNTYKYYGLSYTRNDQLLLKRISFNSGEINIAYTDREDIESVDPNKKAKKVGRLTVKNKSDNNHLRVEFDHSYLGNIVSAATPDDRIKNALNCRLLLDGIAIYQSGGSLDRKYSLSYNESPLPEKNSRYTDHWGYYNEDTELLSYKNFLYAPSYYLRRLDSQGIDRSMLYRGINKNSSITRSQYGILNSIQYPTGGRTIFEYELNEFANDFLDATDSIVKVGCGLRIKNIYDLSDTADTTSVRSFTYKKNGVSSGIIMTVPTYHFIFGLGVKPVLPYYDGIFLNGASIPYSPIMGSASGRYVGYSYVEEKNITHGVNNGYVAYGFMNRANKTVSIGDNIIRSYPSIPEMNNGLPTDITYYDNCSNRIKTIDFQYLRAEQKMIKGLVCYRLPIVIDECFSAKFYDVYSERWVLKAKKEYQYFLDNRYIALKSEYEYNDINWLKNYERISMDGGTVEDVVGTSIKYPSDYGSALSEMVNKNMTGIPVEITRSKNGKIISGSKTSFGNFNNGMYLPQTYSKLDPSSGTYSPQLTINWYDIRGNILQYLDKEDIPTSYLWSYNSEYPVAEIKNATYSQVVAALGAPAIAAITNYDCGTSSPVPNFQEYGEILRSKLPNASISIYTYKPLVGGTGITDSSGRTTRYEYDWSNRLSEIRDDKGSKGNLIQKFEYNIKNNN